MTLAKKLLAVSSAAEKDTKFNYVSLLLSGDGTNGAQNNTFVDSSSNNFSITRYGTPTQGSFSPYSPLGWAVYLSAGNYFSTPTITLGATFTIELWFNLPSASTDLQILLGNGGNNWLSIRETGITFSVAAVDKVVSFSASLGQYHHLAISNSAAGGFLCYLDGVRVGSLTAATGFSNTMIARWGTGSYPFTGYVSNLRMINGTALYSGTTITVPTDVLTAVSGTSLLTFQNNRFRDNSSNNYSLTVTGTPRAQPFSPFVPTSAYVSSLHGGSGYFNGSTDYLEIANNSALDIGTGDFTIEGWWWFGSTANQAMVSKYTASSGYLVQYQAGNIRLVFGSPVVTYSFAWTATPNTWNYIAITRSGTSARAYVNGVQIGSTTTVSVANTEAAVAFSFGKSHTLTEYLNGYASGFRLTKGTALYTGTTMTVPSAPQVSSGNVLLNFIGSNIVDSSSQSDIQTAGNARISTSTSKFGGSMSFDGVAGSYIQSANAGLSTAFGTADFTIEFWVYCNNVTNSQNIFEGRPSADGAYPAIYVNAGTLRYYVSTADRITSSTITTSTWYHVAVCRASGVTKMFVNGTQAGINYTDTTNYLNPGATRPILGTYNGTLSNFSGNIDDLRITLGYARYTTTFVPPTRAHPRQ